MIQNAEFGGNVSSKAIVDFIDAGGNVLVATNAQIGITAINLSLVVICQKHTEYILNSNQVSQYARLRASAVWSTATTTRTSSTASTRTPTTTACTPSSPSTPTRSSTAR